MGCMHVHVIRIFSTFKRKLTTAPFTSHLDRATLPKSWHSAAIGCRRRLTLAHCCPVGDFPDSQGSLFVRCHCRGFCGVALWEVLWMASASSR